jgi:transglutaminase-like putative cysteine protease
MVMLARPRSRTGGLAALVTVLLLGCTQSSARTPRLEYSAAELRQEILRRAPRQPISDLIIPFEIDAEAIEKARRVAMRRSGGQQQILALVDSLSDPDVFGLRYDWGATGSAQQTLERGVGNCLSLASVLIGLARGLGWRAYYVEATPADLEQYVESDVTVWADHMVALVVTPEARAFVDFAGEPDRRYRLKPIDDLAATAHFYNNRASGWIHRAEGDASPIRWDHALADFEMATRIRPEFARAWNNAGVALTRLGRAERAKHAYDTAISIDAELPSPRQNLTLLQGRTEAARRSPPSERREDRSR